MPEVSVDEDDYHGLREDDVGAPRDGFYVFPKSKPKTVKLGADEDFQPRVLTFVA